MAKKSKGVPTKKSRNVAAKTLRKQLDHTVGSLLSGTPRHIADARATIAEHRAAALEWTAADLLDRVKTWISQPPTDDGAKKLAFLDEIRREARATGGPELEDGRWWVKACAARALRYAGLFRRAQRRYQRATKNIKLMVAAEVPFTAHMAHVYADYAEHLAYLGHADKALDWLDKIPTTRREPWHLWVKAFVLHQQGFCERYAFASAKPKPVSKPEARYVESNKILARIAAPDATGLSDSEKCDTNLLVAANWGAIRRLREEFGGDAAEAKKLAIAARDAFTNAIGIGDSANPTWSITKERRGRMPVIFMKKLDHEERAKPLPTKKAVEAWRTALREHYFDNLRQACFPERHASDGQYDKIDDHDGDDDSEE